MLKIKRARLLFGRELLSWQQQLREHWTAGGVPLQAQLCWHPTKRITLGWKKFKNDMKVPLLKSMGFSPDQYCIAARDVDECALGLHNCHSYAICTNLREGYSCACPTGWEDGNPELPVSSLFLHFKLCFCWSSLLNWVFVEAALLNCIFVEAALLQMCFCILKLHF